MVEQVNLDYLFVYGTLRLHGLREVPRVLTRLGTPVATGHLKGVLFDLGPYPGAVSSSVDESLVRGDVYRIRNGKKLLAALDAYEGCGPEDPFPTEFRREIMDVMLDNGVSIKAWGYLYNRSTDGLKRIASGDYVEYLRRREQ